MKKRLNYSQKEEKRYKITKLIGGIIFLLSGLLFGIIWLACNKWNFIGFITNPTTILILLCTLAIGIFLLSTMEVK